MIAALLAIAAAWWGPAPCGSPVVVEVPQRQIAQETGIVLSIGDAYVADCVVHVAPGLARNDACKVVVHEYGHLMGLGHSADPNDIMYGEHLTTYWPWCDPQPELNYSTVERVECATLPGVHSTPWRGKWLTTRTAPTSTRRLSWRPARPSTSPPRSSRTTWRSTCSTGAS